MNHTVNQNGTQQGAYLQQGCQCYKIVAIKQPLDKTSSHLTLTKT